MKFISSKVIIICLVLAIISFGVSFYNLGTKIKLLEIENMQYKQVIQDYNTTVEDLKVEILRVSNIANHNAKVAAKLDNSKAKQVIKVKVKKEDNYEVSNDINLTRELDRLWEQTINSK